MNKQKEIELIIANSKDNDLFAPKDFLGITSYNNAKLILARLVEQGKLKRLIEDNVILKLKDKLDKNDLKELIEASKKAPIWICLTVERMTKYDE